MSTLAVGNCALEEIAEDVRARFLHYIYERPEPRREKVDRTLSFFFRDMFVNCCQIFLFHEATGQGANRHREEIVEDLAAAP